MEKLKTEKRSKGRPISNLPVAKETLEFWLENYQVGDQTEIAEKKSMGRPTIRKAFRGAASQQHVDKITEFYNERKKGKNVIHEKIKLTKVL